LIIRAFQILKRRNNFKKHEKIQKARGPARAFPGRAGSGSGRAFFDPARARPGPVSGRAGLGPRVRGPGRPGPKEPGLARGGPARGPTLEFNLSG